MEFIFVFMITLSLIIAASLYTGSSLLSFKVRVKNKINSYESGFSSIGNVQTTFSVHFFIILLIFLIFDLEVVFLLMTLFISPSIIIILFLLLLFVLGGVYLEWNLGNLSWVV